MRHVSCLATLTLLALPLTAQQHKVTQAEVDRITKEAILIDTHNDVTSLTVTGYDIATPNKSGQTDLARMKGFLGAEFFAVFVGAEYVNGNHSANRTLQMIDTVRTDVVAAHPNEFVFATTADEIVRAHNEHKIAALKRDDFNSAHSRESGNPVLIRNSHAAWQKLDPSGQTLVWLTSVGMSGLILIQSHQALVADCGSRDVRPGPNGGPCHCARAR